jgi:ankyrin repeat protein
MSEFLLRPYTLNISLIRAIEDDDDKDDEYLKEVLSSGVDLNALGKNTWANMPTTAIIMATNTENTNKVRLLLETGRVKNINQADGFGRSPLFVASENGNYEIAKILLEYGADPKLPPIKYLDGYGVKSKTPLDVAKNDKMRELLRNSTGLGLKKIKKLRKTNKRKLRTTNKRKKNSKQKK